MHFTYQLHIKFLKLQRHFNPKIIIIDQTAAYWLMIIFFIAWRWIGLEGVIGIGVGILLSIQTDPTRSPILIGKGLSIQKPQIALDYTLIVTPTAWRLFWIGMACTCFWFTAWIAIGFWAANIRKYYKNT